jgi:hypothetical protein
MQEAIGAQYMQKHLPKLEPFLRRVVSTSIPLLFKQLGTCLGCRTGKKFISWCNVLTPLRIQVQEEVHNVLIRHIDSANRLAS